MFKIIRKGLPVMLLALFGLFLYPGKVLAASVQPLTINVTTVIDNSSDYPDQAGKI